MSEEFRKFVEFTRDRVKRLLKENEQQLKMVEEEVDNDLLMRGIPGYINGLRGDEYYKAQRVILIAAKKKPLEVFKREMHELYSNLDLALRNTA